MSLARVCPGAVGACRTARVDDLIRRALGASHEIDLVTFHLICAGGRRVLDDQALASLTRPLGHVILVQIEVLGHVSLREVETQELQTSPPNPPRLMRPGQEGVRQIVDALATGLAEITLTRGLGVVATVLGHLHVLTHGTPDALWPTQGTDGLNALSLVEERWHGYHGVSIAQGST